MTGAGVGAGGMPLGTKPGMVLMVPVPDGVLANADVGTSKPLEIYGVDFLLTAGGDLAIPGDSTDAGDLSVTKGIPLLVQALTVRLLTPQGQHGAFSGYGIPNLIGTRGLAETAGLLASHCRSQLERDPRINRVSRLTVLDEGDQYTVDSTALVRGGPPIDVSVPITGVGG